MDRPVQKDRERALQLFLRLCEQLFHLVVSLTTVCLRAAAERETERGRVELIVFFFFPKPKVVSFGRKRLSTYQGCAGRQQAADALDGQCLGNGWAVADSQVPRSTAPT